jgi:putative addiction module component (TIGR02574 family)
MTALAEKIYDEALDLPANERLGLIDKLLESINPSVKVIQEAWIEEAEKRLQKYRSGKVEAIPGEEVFKEAVGKVRRSS